MRQSLKTAITAKDADTRTVGERVRLYRASDIPDTELASESSPCEVSLDAATQPSHYLSLRDHAPA